LAESPGLAKPLTIPHLLIWALFIGYFLLRKAHSLIIEPYVTLQVLMGAASGYLLIGYAGGFLLHTLLIWQPDAFELTYLLAGLNPVSNPLRVFPAMVSASFEALPTVSNTVGQPRPSAETVRRAGHHDHRPSLCGCADCPGAGTLQSQTPAVKPRVQRPAGAGLRAGC
jgi:hypothetical protein